MLRSLSTFALLALLTCLSLAPTTAWAQYTMKVATTESGSSAIGLALTNWGKLLERRSNGQLRIKLYSGASMGSDDDALKKMRLSQLHAATLNSAATATVDADLYALSLPYLYPDTAALDSARSTLDAEIRQKLDAKGYVLISWYDPGPIHIFTNAPIDAQSPLLSRKSATSSNSTLMKVWLSGLVSLTGLNYPDILPAFQTGILNTVLAPPRLALSTGWYGKTAYMSEQPISYEVGTFLLNKSFYTSLPADVQTALTADTAALNQHILQTMRGEQTTAIAQMKAKGVQTFALPADLQTALQQRALAVREEQRGKLYTSDWLSRVLSTAPAPIQ